MLGRLDGKTYVYMVRCYDNSLYTGWTTDLDNRVKTHNSGKGAKYTSKRLPVELVYFELVDGGKSEGMKREYRVKKLKKKEKEIMVREFNRELLG